MLFMAWAFWAWFPKLWKPSLQDLLEKKAYLKECVVHWQYPNGSHVPQHKRQRMFRDLQKLSQAIREHPDNPANHNKSEHTDSLR